jgi:hypothetical protein
MITLTSSWTDTRLGCTFPTGTVFIPHRNPNLLSGGRVWSYGTPNGGHGECHLAEGVVPGVE